MDLDLKATLVNMVLQDPRDKGFISTSKKYLDALSEEEKDNDTKEIISIFTSILAHNIQEPKEILFNLGGSQLSDDLKAGICDNTKYTNTYKKDILAKLSSKASVSNIEPYINKIQKLIGDINMLGGSKNGTEALFSLYDKIQELNKVAYQNRITNASGNVLIIDPTLPPDQCTRNTLSGVLNDLKLSASNKIHTISVIDNFVGGGFGPKSLNIFAAIGGHGKSLVLQNILLYASKNNKIEYFDVEDTNKPCLVLVSLELTRKQLFGRHLAFCGIHLTDDEIDKMDEEALEIMVGENNAKFGFNIPVIYIERLQGTAYTSCSEIEDELSGLMNVGYQPVMVAIDYLDRLEVVSQKHKTLGLTGADGSALLRQKGHECRDLGVKFNIPVITAAQLNGEGQAAMGKVEPFLRKIDILHHFDLGMLAGSKVLQTEVETIIYCHSFDIECKSQDEEILKTDHYMAMTVVKDRDGKSRYYLSERDNLNEAAYKRYTMQIRNNIGLSELFKQTARHYAVIPSNGFVLDEKDYGRSIRMFYTGEQNEFVGLNDLMKSYGGSDNVINSISAYIPGMEEEQKQSDLAKLDQL